MNQSVAPERAELVSRLKPEQRLQPHQAVMVVALTDVFGQGPAVPFHYIVCNLLEAELGASELPKRIAQNQKAKPAGGGDSQR